MYNYLVIYILNLTQILQMNFVRFSSICFICIVLLFLYVVYIFLYIVYYYLYICSFVCVCVYIYTQN